MYKVLLAGAALVGSVGVAHAQTTAPTLPLAPGSYPTKPSIYLGGNNIMDQDGNRLPDAPMVPTPGTMTIHLNARINFYAAVDGSSLNTYNGNKLAPDQFLGYFRLYPGVDAMATNGLRYGAIVEIRQNFLGQSYGLNATPGTPLAGNAPGSNFSTSPSASSSGSTLYVRREAIYIGSNELGIIRLGQDDGPLSQLDNGVTTFQNFNDAGWNGDVNAAAPSATQPIFPFFASNSSEYTIDKVVYFTPRFYGFDGAISWAPNNAPANDSACAAAGPGCANTTSAANNSFGGGARPTNMYEIMGRYRGTVGPVGIYGIAGYAGSGHTDVPVTVGTQYNGFSVGDVGLVLSYAGFSVGGNVQLGDYDGTIALQPKGGKSAVAWLVGAQYANGPITIGASYYNYQSQGSAALVGKSQRYDDGLAAGLTYKLAPGLLVYVSYLYGQVHQGGYDFATASVGSAYNDVHSQVFSLGTRVAW
jgi:predicted porin